MPVVWRLVLSSLPMVVVGTGCGAPDAKFRLNEVYVLAQEKQLDDQIPGHQIEDVENILVALFGTPDQPHAAVLEGVETSKLFQVDKLKMAAGRVSSEAQGEPHGLFREHCAHCHGITGDGAGPTAQFLNPYPRDFRLGIFKFKSTPIGQRPTHEDLKTILTNGIPGTAMPSFRLLPADELEALVQYVKYLSVRGEVERALIYECANELEKEQHLIDVGSKEASKDAKYVASIAADVIEKWQSANAASIAIPKRPDDWDLADSIKKGRDLYFGPVANCVKCHGDTALGDGQTNDWDDWTKDWTTKIGIDPKNRDEIRPFLAKNAPRPRNILPRNLRLGVYRGGRRPIDMYRRLKNGIEGTPMPAVPQTLQPDDIWHLIDYVRSLPYEQLSESGLHRPEFQRERM